MNKNGSSLVEVLASFLIVLMIFSLILPLRVGSQKELHGIIASLEDYFEILSSMSLEEADNYFEEYSFLGRYYQANINQAYSAQGHLYFFKIERVRDGSLILDKIYEKVI